jgi:hypothetical protein
MIAAIYARKSSDQTGVADEQKSVARQIEHARAFALRKGWTIDDTHVYADDDQRRRVCQPARLPAADKFPEGAAGLSGAHHV